MECTVKLISDRGRPIPGAHVLVFSQNGAHAGGVSANVSDNPISLPLTLNDKLIEMENKVPIDDRIEVGSKKGLFLTGPKKMKMICAAEFHKAEILNDFVPKDQIEINLQQMGSGGSAIFPHGYGSIPNFHGYLNFDYQSNTARLMEVYLEDSSMNSKRKKLAQFDIISPVVLKDEQGGRISLTIKDIVDKAVLFEYEWLSPNPPRPGPTIISAPWRPLPLRSAGPSYKEIAANCARSLGELREALRKENEYVQTHTKEFKRISKNIESLQRKLENDLAIYKTDIKKASYGLKRLAKRLGEVARIAKKIASAIYRLALLTEILDEWLPEDIKNLLSDELQKWAKKILDIFK